MPFAALVLAAFVPASGNLPAKRAAPAGWTFVFAYTLFSCLAYAPWAAWLLAQGGGPDPARRAASSRPRARCR